VKNRRFSFKLSIKPKNWEAVMANEIWFIQNEDEEPVRAFMSKAEAEHELENLAREEEGDYFVYALDLEEIDDYPEEMAVATEEGLV